MAHKFLVSFAHDARMRKRRETKRPVLISIEPWKEPRWREEPGELTVRVRAELHGGGCKRMGNCELLGGAYLRIKLEHVYKHA